MLNVATLQPQMFVATLFRCKIVLGSLLSGEIAFRVLPRASDPNRSEQNTLLLLNSAVNPFFCSPAFSDVIVIVDHRGTRMNTRYGVRGQSDISRPRRHEPKMCEF